MPLVLLIAALLFVAGFFIASRYFKNPAALLFGGLAIGAGLCAVVMAILYAGCLLVMRS